VSEWRASEVGYFTDKTVADYAAGPRMQAAVTEDGLVYTWGDAGEAMGHGERRPRTQPTLVGAITGKKIIKAALGRDEANPFMLLLTEKGDVLSCGINRCARWPPCVPER
jgi:hypothetical protein